MPAPEDRSLVPCGLGPNPQADSLGSLLIIGAGGHAKVVLAAARTAGWRVIGLLDDNPRQQGRNVLGVPVRGGIDMADELAADAAVLAIGDNRVRKRLAEQLHLSWATVVHPTAWIDPSVQLGEGAVVMAGAVIQPDTRIGRHAIVNTGARIDHDCRIADHVHVAPGTALAGSVRVGEGTFIGIGASVIPGIAIGAWTTIGAGAAVVNDIPGSATAVGVPARPLPGRIPARRHT